MVSTPIFEMGEPVIDNLSPKRICDVKMATLNFVVFAVLFVAAVCDGCRYCFYTGDAADCRDVIAPCIQLSPPSPPPKEVFVYSCQIRIRTDVSIVKDRLGNDCGKYKIIQLFIRLGYDILKMGVSEFPFTKNRHITIFFFFLSQCL